MEGVKRDARGKPWFKMKTDECGGAGWHLAELAAARTTSREPSPACCPWYGSGNSLPPHKAGGQHCTGYVSYRPRRHRRGSPDASTAANPNPGPNPSPKPTHACTLARTLARKHAQAADGPAPPVGSRARAENEAGADHTKTQSNCQCQSGWGTSAIVGVQKGRSGDVKRAMQPSTYVFPPLAVGGTGTGTGRHGQKQAEAGPGLSRIGHVHPPHRIAASILVGLVGMRFSLALVGLSACDVRESVVVWCVNLWERVGEVMSG